MLQGLRGHRYHDNVSLCTDDVHAKDLLETGHINRIMKKLIELGVDPMDAIRWGTYNAAREAGMADLGAVAPGYAADLQLVEELDGRNPFAVFVGGELMCEDGRLCAGPSGAEKVPFPNTVQLSWLRGEEDFYLVPPGPDSSRLSASRRMSAKHFSAPAWKFPGRRVTARMRASSSPTAYGFTR